MKPADALTTPPLPLPVRQLAYRLGQLRKRPGVYTLILIVDEDGGLSLAVQDDRRPAKLERLG